MIKTLGSSTKFMAAAILYSVMVLFVILSAFGSQNMIDQLYYYGANYGGVNPDVFYSMMSVLENSTVIGAVLGAIPAILIAVGMWLFYATCRNTQSGNVSTVGLTICKVLTILSLVLFCVAVALSLLVIVIVMVALASNLSTASYYGYDAVNTLAVVQVFLGILIVVFVAIAVLYIFYYVSVIKVINRIKASAINGVPDNRIPRFLTGFLMFLGVVNALGGLVVLFTSLMAGISTLASAVCFILMSLLLREYRDKMTMLLFPPVQPMYSNMPPYNTVPPQQPSGPNENTPQS
ncbi:MAG: hypothetical protein ACOYJZ_03345 [Acutalibacter sp.]